MSGIEQPQGDPRPDGYQGDYCRTCGEPWGHGTGSYACQAATVCDACIDHSRHDALLCERVWEAWSDEREEEIAHLRAQVERLRKQLGVLSSASRSKP